MTKPRVLVGVVTYEGKDYIFPKCYEAIRNFDYPSDRYDTLIVDNTEGHGYANQMKRRGYRKVEHVKRGKNSRIALAKSQNLIRKYALENDYDYVLFIESDLVPQPNTINRLLAHRKRVVGSWYLLGHDYKFPCIFLNAKKGSFTGTRPVGVVEEDGERKAHPQEIREWWQSGLRECEGCGLGCTLVRTSLLEDYPFFNDHRFDTHHSDVWWYMSLRRDNIPVFVDTDVNVPHYPSDWGDVEDR